MQVWWGDEERILAAKKAAHLWRWRPGFFPVCHFMFHSCVDEKCPLVKVQYMTKIADVGRKEVFVCLLHHHHHHSSASTKKDVLFPLIPVYGCERTGDVHICGIECEYRTHKNTCPLSGIYFGEKIDDGRWYAPYDHSSVHQWKQTLQEKKERFPPANDMREILQQTDDMMIIFSAVRNEIEPSKRRDGINSKRAAFNLSFALVATVLSDNRFIQVLNSNRECRQKLEDQARRAVAHMIQQRHLVDTETILMALPDHVESTPILIQNDKERLSRIIKCAEQCVALWHVIWTYVDKAVNDISFRDFCVAAINLFSCGHNVPNRLTMHDSWVIIVDPVLKAFPIDHWVKRQIYWDRQGTKITATIRRSEEGLRKMIDDYVVRRGLDPAYLRYTNVPYDSLPEHAFTNIKR